MASKPKGNPLQIDGDVVIPEAVRRAAAAADAAMQAANPQPEPAPQPVANNDQITIAEPPAPTGLPERVPLQIEPAPPPAPQPEPPPQPQPPADEADAATWKNRYEAMLGRFRDATSQLTQAQSRMEALENMLATVQTAPRAPTAEPVRFLTKKDEEDMGPEMIDFVKRAAQEVAGTKIAELEATVQNLTRQLQGTVQHVETDARAAMHTALADKLPNWQQINHDPDFHAWLALQDPFSGVMRKKLLTDAYAQNQTARVLSIFQGFVSETAATRPAAPAEVLPPAPAPQGQQPTRPTLEELAAPGRARTAAAPSAPAEKQLIRTSDINNFWAAVRRGAYKGREELQRQHEEELNLAMREGRILRDT